MKTGEYEKGITLSDRGIGIIRRILAAVMGVMLLTFSMPQPVLAAEMTIRDGVLVKYRVDNGVTSVTIPYGIVGIANEAFSGDTSLEEIEIPGSVKIIGERAFYNCNSLKEIDIPEGVQTIGESAFSHCTSLETAYLPSTVRSIGNGIFAGATELDEIEVDKDNPYFFANDGVLYDKYSTKLIQYGAGKTDEIYDMPFTVREVAPYAFWGADNLKAIYVSNGVEDILPLSFANAKGLEAVFLPNSVGSIQQYAFRDDYNLRLIGVEEDTIDVHPSAFYGCPANLGLSKVSPNIDLVRTAELIKIETVSGNRTVRGKVVQSNRETAGKASGSGNSASADKAKAASANGSKKYEKIPEREPSDNKAPETSSNSNGTSDSTGNGNTLKGPQSGYAYVNETPGYGRVIPNRTVGLGRIDGSSVYIVPVH